MAHPKTSERRAKNISLALCLVLLAIISFTGFWWPYIMLGIGIPLALKHYLLSKHRRMVVTLLTFCGFFITVQYSLPWNLLLPILFFLGALYLFGLEFFDQDPVPEFVEEEDLNKEIEENDHNN